MDEVPAGLYCAHSKPCFCISVSLSPWWSFGCPRTGHNRSSECLCGWIWRMASLSFPLYQKALAALWKTFQILLLIKPQPNGWVMANSQMHLGTFPVVLVQCFFLVAPISAGHVVPWPHLHTCSFSEQIASFFRPLCSAGPVFNSYGKRFLKEPAMPTKQRSCWLVLTFPPADSFTFHPVNFPNVAVSAQDLPCLFIF